MPIAEHILGPRYFKGPLMVLKIDNDMKMNKTHVENIFQKLIINNKKLYVFEITHIFINSFKKKIYFIHIFFDPFTSCLLILKLTSYHLRYYLLTPLQNSHWLTLNKIKTKKNLKLTGSLSFLRSINTHFSQETLMHLPVCHHQT